MIFLCFEMEIDNKKFLIFHNEIKCVFSFSFCDRNKSTKTTLFMLSKTGPVQVPFATLPPLIFRLVIYMVASSMRSIDELSWQLHRPFHTLEQSPYSRKIFKPWYDFYVSVLFNLLSFLIFEPISYFSILYLMVSMFWYGLFFLNSGRKSVHKFHGWMAKYAPGTVLSRREYRRVSFRDGRLHFWK